MRVLVCGGRDFDDARLLDDTLCEVASRHRLDRVIQGGAQGADALARAWCVKWQCPFEHYPADWDTHGRAAGPIRNQRMLDEGKPDLVVAFPGGVGTADMVRRARKAGVEVMEIA